MQNPRSRHRFPNSDIKRSLYIESANRAKTTSAFNRAS
jgi:hypothetical protein